MIVAVAAFSLRLLLPRSPQGDGELVGRPTDIELGSDAWGHRCLSGLTVYAVGFGFDRVYVMAPPGHGDAVTQRPKAQMVMTHVGRGRLFDLGSQFC